MSSQDRDRERRLNARISDETIHIEYVAPSPHVRDLSISGCYILDARTLQRGQQLQLRIRFEDGDPIVAGAMVRRVDAGVGMAVEFLQMDANDRHRLKEYLLKASPGSVSPAGADIFE